MNVNLSNIFGTLFKNNQNQTSSFRVGWFIFIVVTVFVWAILSIKNNAIQQWPFDSTTTIFILYGSQAKTISERLNINT